VFVTAVCTTALAVSALYREQIRAEASLAEPAGGSR
jgi:hypothetical protein